MEPSLSNLVGFDKLLFNENEKNTIYALISFEETIHDKNDEINNFITLL